MTLAELASITIEISVLSPLSELHDKTKIEIGKHGLVIDDGFRRGLFAAAGGNGVRMGSRTISQTQASKAGLPSDAWKQNEVKLSRSLWKI